MKSFIDQIPAGKDASILADLQEKAYREAHGLSQSALKDFITKSPAHFLASQQEVKETTKAMEFGTAFHAVMLQQNPKEFYAVKQKMDGRTKEGKAYNETFAIDNAGKAVIDTEDEVKILAMRESVLAHPLARKLHNLTTERELAVFGTLQTMEDDVRLKGRIDAYCEDDGFILDYKSCEDASPNGFKKAIYDFRYDIQNVQYPWLIKNAGKKFTKFYFIAVEKKPPYAVGVYSISDGWLTYTADLWFDAVNRFGVCTATKTFPAYSDAEVVLS